MQNKCNTTGTWAWRKTCSKKTKPTSSHLHYMYLHILTVLRIYLHIYIHISCIYIHNTDDISIYIIYTHIHVWPRCVYTYSHNVHILRYHCWKRSLHPVEAADSTNNQLGSLGQDMLQIDLCPDLPAGGSSRSFKRPGVATRSCGLKSFKVLCPLCPLCPTMFHDFIWNIQKHLNERPVHLQSISWSLSLFPHGLPIVCPSFYDSGIGHRPWN